jgi:hypothetical protein
LIGVDYRCGRIAIHEAGGPWDATVSIAALAVDTVVVETTLLADGGGATSARSGGKHFGVLRGQTPRWFKRSDVDHRNGRERLQPCFISA